MTYSDLQNALVDLLDDTEVDAARAREFIALAEPKLDRDILDSANGGGVPRQKLARITGQTDANSAYALPADFHRARTVVIGPSVARYALPELVPSAQPGYAQTAVNLDYYQLLPALSDTNTSNWMLDIGFDAYLYGAALQWISWGQDESNLGLWTTYYRDALRTVKSTHGPQPRGNRRRFSTRAYGALYTVIGDTMYFGTAR